jgi:pimeloyl-ACP methyl ester carboxylesterase
MRRIPGFLDLTFDLVEQTTNLVERTHDASVARTVRRFAPIEPAKSVADLVTGIQCTISASVFESIRLGNRFARTATRVATGIAETQLERTTDPSELELATPIQSDAAWTASWVVDSLEASINGFWGDYINRRQNRLDLGVSFRHRGRRLPSNREAMAAAFPEATPKVCVFVHGLATTEWLWSLSSDRYYGTPDVTFGTRLQTELGFTPIYVRYNTGRHISENGRSLAKRLTELLEAYPAPIEEIALVGHSMGGLVARSAGHYAHTHGAPWLERLRHVACIGSPHLGAPLEKSANLLTWILRRLDAAGADVPAALLDARSAGIKDLRYGYTIDEEWIGRDPDRVFADARRNVPLVDGVGYYFLAATITRDLHHPVGQLLGDLLVRLPSAAGEAPEPARRIPFRSGAVFTGMHHVHLANHPDVYEALRDLLAQ